MIMIIIVMIIVMIKHQLDNQEKIIRLTQDITSVDTYFSVGSFNNGTIADLFSTTERADIYIDIKLESS